MDDRRDSFNEDNWNACSVYLKTLNTTKAFFQKEKRKIIKMIDEKASIGCYYCDGITFNSQIERLMVEWLKEKGFTISQAVDSMGRTNYKISWSSSTTETEKQ